MQNPWEQQAKREKSRRLMNVKAITTPELIHFQCREREDDSYVDFGNDCLGQISSLMLKQVCSHVTGRNGGLQ